MISSVFLSRTDHWEGAVLVWQNTKHFIYFFGTNYHHCSSICCQLEMLLWYGNSWCAITTGQPLLTIIVAMFGTRYHNETIFCQLEMQSGFLVCYHHRAGAPYKASWSDRDNDPRVQRRRQQRLLRYCGVLAILCMNYFEPMTETMTLEFRGSRLQQVCNWCAIPVLSCYAWTILQTDRDNDPRVKLTYCGEPTVCNSMPLPPCNLVAWSAITVLDLMCLALV